MVDFITNNHKCKGFKLKDYDMMAHWKCTNFVRC